MSWKNHSNLRIILSFIPDWLLVVCMAVASYGLDFITPFRREFSMSDKTIMHSHTPSDSVSMLVVVLVCLVAPLVIMAIVSLGIQRSFVDFHSGVLGLCLSLSMVTMLTTVIKITVGRPRPDFIARCQPPAGAVDPPFGFSNYTICTADINSPDMIDGFQSFPSGHSSFSFGGLMYLAFYFAGKMKLFDQRGYTYKGFVFSFPLIGALLIAISRTQDYRHHWQDVLAGSLLGLCTAYYAYRQYYPSLADSRCRMAYTRRIDYFKRNEKKSSGKMHHFQNDSPGQHTYNTSQPLGDSYAMQVEPETRGLDEEQGIPFIDNLGRTTDQTPTLKTWSNKPIL